MDQTNWLCMYCRLSESLSASPLFFSMQSHYIMVNLMSSDEIKKCLLLYFSVCRLNFLNCTHTIFINSNPNVDAISLEVP